MAEKENTNQQKERSEFGNELSESAKENARTGERQTHENREEPLKDHVPGHLGYSDAVPGKDSLRK